MSLIDRVQRPKGGPSKAQVDAAQKAARKLRPMTPRALHFDFISRIGLRLGTATHRYTDGGPAERGIRERRIRGKAQRRARQVQQRKAREKR